MDGDDHSEQPMEDNFETEQQEIEGIPTPAGSEQQTAQQIHSGVGLTPVQPFQPRTLFSQMSSPRVGGSLVGTPQSVVNWISSPQVGTLPRGDMGHSSTYLTNRGPTTRLPAGFPPTPGTPMSAVQSPAQQMRRPLPPHRRTGAAAAAGVPPLSATSQGSLGVAGAFEDDPYGDGRGADGSGAMDLHDTDTTFELDAEDEAALQQASAETRIWGTELNVAAVSNVFASFLEFYGAGAGGSGKGYYLQQLEVLHRTGDVLLNLNCSHLKAWPGTRNFYQQLRRYPQELIPLMDKKANEVYRSLYGPPHGGRFIQVRTFGLEEQSRMRSLDPKDIDRLLCIKGMVVRCSTVIPDLKQAYFRCFVCASSCQVLIDRGRIEEPGSCPQCQTKGAMEIIHNRGAYSDKQQIRLQETPDEIPAGETPHTVTLFAFDDLVDTVRPGDRIEVTGVFRAVPNRANPHMRTVKTIYKTYIDAVHFRRAEQGDDRAGTAEDVAGIDRTVERPFPAAEQSGEDSATAKHFSPARIAEFYAFAAQGNAYERLVRSFAPSIWEMEDVKRGLLCLLFGGTIRKGTKRQRELQRRRILELARRSSGESKSGTVEQEEEGTFDFLGEDADLDAAEEAQGGVREDVQGGVHQRGDINVLLCGDPGTSKSQLLSYVHKLTPRGIYTSGKGSSAVGLTASVVRDPDTRDMVLESGALVLSDNGICCIDEFDKMTDQTRAILHEAMEQQTVSITKAGIIATLNARTSILASANPVQSRYNAKLSVVENIKLPPTLLSRFDLIYLILDKPNQDSDRKLAKHLVALYYDDDGAEDATTADSNDPALQPVDQRFLRDYIAYARSNVCPEISAAAEEVLVRNYVEMRSLGGRSMKTITATPRQLESLIRLSQALAKMRLDEVVEAKDVLEATRLMKVATQTAATDPRTGTIDMDMITTGQTALGRELVHQLADEVRRFLRDEYAAGRHTSHVNQVYQELRRNMAANAGGMSGVAEAELTVDRVFTAVEMLSEEKCLFLARNRAITIHESIVHPQY